MVLPLLVACFIFGCCFCCVLVVLLHCGFVVLFWLFGQQQEPKKNNTKQQQKRFQRVLYCLLVWFCRLFWCFLFCLIIVLF